MSQGDFRYVVARAPLRITFTGGGSDFPEFFKKSGLGAVVSSTINKYIYVTISRNFYPDEYRISYSKTENAIKNIDEIQHPTVREALKLLDIKKGVQIVSITEVPSRGTGLGSSSSFLVALLLALHTWLGENVSQKEIANEACKIEREILKEPGGFQDQYMAAFGGINLLRFYPDDVEITKITLNQSQRRDLESHLVMFYTGKERYSSEIHSDQVNHIDDHYETYEALTSLALKTVKPLHDLDYVKLGNLMKEGWELKKSLSDGISDPEIDKIYKIGIDTGAYGGKLMGAGGGGFMLFLIPPEKKEILRKELSEYRMEPFSLEPFGARVIFTEDL